MFKLKFSAKSFIQGSSLLLSIGLIAGCSGSSETQIEPINYSASNLTEKGKVYNISIEQDLAGSIITASGKIKFNPTCEYTLNANAYDDPSNEYVFNINKSSNDTTFIRGKAPDSLDFNDWGDYRDPMTPRALVMLYPLLVLDGNTEGYLCNLDKMYNFVTLSEDNKYVWNIDFLEKYTTYSSELWRDNIIKSLDMTDSNSKTLKDYLSGIIVPDYTFALKTFPEVFITKENKGLSIKMESDSDVKLRITLTESDEDFSVEKVNAVNFLSALKIDVEGLTERQILEQFKPIK